MLNWKRFRAPFCPYFLRSFIRESRVKNPFRRNPTRSAAVDLNLAIDEAVRFLRRTIDPRILLTVDATRDLWPVQADPGQINQVLINLALNARDAMPGGGTLTISSGNVRLSEAQGEALGLAPSAYVMLAVGDTGSGIDQAARARIFERFFTTKEKAKGTGLGLSTALGIVQQSGGGIDLETAVGEGSTFRVYLPRTERPLQSSYSVPPARLTAHDKPEAKAQANVPAPHFELHPARRSLR